MSFRRFIYYCALCGGWAAFLGWIAGRLLFPNNSLGTAGVRGMWLGLTVAMSLCLVDSLWNISRTKVYEISGRVGVAGLMGCVAGLLGGVVGQTLYSWTDLEVFYILGWTLTGLLVGASVGFRDLLFSLAFQRDVSGSLKKFSKASLGGMLGGLLGGIISWALKELINRIFENRDVTGLWAPTAWGFVALGSCIGLLIGLAQVVLKDAWIKIEKGRRAGKEMFLTRERTQIGRAESCDIGLFGDNQIEKLHASILLVGNRYHVVDRQTPAGTYVNEELVVGMTPLKSGDRIRVGGSVLRFKERARRE